MSNAPFKIAFWVMSLAFGLTVLLTGLKPEAIRSALNPKLQGEEELANRDFFLDEDLSEFDLPAPDESISQVRISRQQSWNEPPSGLRPIQVASADIDASLGLAPKFSASEPERFSLASATPHSASSHQPIEEEIHILVPDPVGAYRSSSHTSVSDDVNHLKKKVLRLQLARARRELDDIQRETERQEVQRVEAELRQLRTQIVKLKQQRLSIQEVAAASDEKRNALPELEIPESVTSKSMPLDFVEREQVIDRESRIEVVASTTEKTFSFHFENADIHDVLETLATQAGWNVVIRPDVQGTFSGKFENAAPDQAFATVIKLQSFGVSFRGDYVLVRAHKDARIR